MWNFLYVFVFLGPEGLLWSPHIWTAVKPRSFHPHQLDRPRWKRLLFILQCLRFISMSLRKPQKEMEGWEDFICERRRHVTHSVFIITMPEYLRANNHLNPTFYSSSSAVLFIKKWNHKLCVSLTLHPVCCGAATFNTGTRQGAKKKSWLHLWILCRLMFTRVHGVNTGLSWSIALYCIRLNKDFNPFIISLCGPYSLGAVNRIEMCLCSTLN